MCPCVRLYIRGEAHIKLLLSEVSKLVLNMIRSMTDCLFFHQGCQDGQLRQMSDTVQPPVCNVFNPLHKFQAGSLPCLVSVILFPVSIPIHCLAYRLAGEFENLSCPAKSWHTNPSDYMSLPWRYQSFFFFTTFSATVCSSDTSLRIVLLSNSYYGYSSFDLSKKAKQKSTRKKHIIMLF